MIDLRIKGTCRTCRYWDQRYPQNQQLGVCPALGVLLMSGDEVAIVSKNPEWSGLPVSDVAAVRTTADFGCIHHDPRKP